MVSKMQEKSAKSLTMIVHVDAYRALLVFILCYAAINLVFHPQASKSPQISAVLLNIFVILRGSGIRTLGSRPASVRWCMEMLRPWRPWRVGHRRQRPAPPTVRTPKRRTRKSQRQWSGRTNSKSRRKATGEEPALYKHLP
jgi:hypothetical protein